MKKLTTILLLLVLYRICPAQIPDWYSHKPVSKLPNVILGVGEGYNMQEAFNNALIDAAGEGIGLAMSSQSLVEMGKGLEITLPASNKKVKRMASQQTPSGKAYMLIAVQKSTLEPPNFDKEEFTDCYDFMPSAFIPGMAQLQKGSTTKGVLFIAGEAVLIGGVVIAENLRASYHSKINTTHNASDKQNNINNADNWQNIRNGLIAGAAALYVWNVIDGIAAKGNLHIRLLSDNNLKITPYATPNEGGISLAFNF